MSSPKSSEGSSDDAVEVSEEEIKALSSQLESDPFIYDVHVQLINLLKRAGDLDRLREAREKMASLFPLTPEWIKDESSLLLEGADRSGVENLFRRAVADYQSVDVWLEYCQFAIGGMGSGEPERIAAVRAIFELALANQGLNFAKGAVLWEIYREFETILLAQVQASSNDPEALTSQLKIIDSVFRRQLRVAHQDMQATLEEYKDFLTDLGAPLLTGGGGTETVVELKDGIPADCAADFSRASAKAAACQPYEDAVADAEEDEEEKLLAAWETYLDWAVVSCSQKATKSVVQKRSSATADAAPPPPLTPFEVICLFERAITALCLHPSVWLKAADFLEAQVAADTERLFKLLARSVRNVLWSGALWRRYALVSETQALKEVADLNGTVATVDSGAQESALTKALKHPEAIFEAALKCCFADPAELRLIWTAYGDFWLRRLLHASDGIGGGEMKELIHCACLLNHTLILLLRGPSAFGDNGDPDCSLPRYWAFIESKYAGDSGRAQGLWTRMLKMNNNGSKPAFWLSYLDFENMAINSVTGPLAEPVFEAAIRSLAELGLNLQRLREFETKVRARRTNLASIPLRAPVIGGEGDMPMQALESQQLKKTKGSRAPVAADQRQQASSWTVKRKSDAHGTTDFKQPPNKRSKAEVEVVKGTVKPTVPNSSRPRHGETVAHDPSKDDRTVFVSNLPFKATEADLQRVFEPVRPHYISSCFTYHPFFLPPLYQDFLFFQCGQIASVRLVRDFAGRSKGFAYVEFTAPGDPVTAALAMDRQPLTPAADTSSESDTNAKPLQGRPMFVSMCHPNRSEPKQFAYSTGVPEPKKLFVRNLEKHVSEAALRTLFSQMFYLYLFAFQHGTVTNVRLVTFRNGMPKGHAYVEFATEEEASRALTATDGLTVGNKQISVAISNPPRKEEPHAAGGPPHFGGKGGSKMDNLSGPPRSHAGSHLAFMPRALNRGSAVLPADAEVPRPTPADEAPKSNADFRKLFLKD
ncbi:unnamed protein product [Schistocephalus solidus]|uniref:Squamous cell carcinoma antigen recognized by T-cells 3 n=1 Tax=Schistocephalus solidus TaxID=70667 RepID=A0A183T8Y1_SCHSO|nr:unnamed protein product [Schistocephalus solidus]